MSPHRHCGASWPPLKKKKKKFSFQQTPSSLPLLPIPQTLHREEKCCFGGLEHLATCTILGDPSDHPQEATATSLEVTVWPLGSLCLPLWSLNTGTLTGILTISPFFSRNSKYTCRVISRPANNYPVQHDHCSGSLGGRIHSHSVYNPPLFLLPSWRVGKACEQTGLGLFSECSWVT